MIKQGIVATGRGKGELSAALDSLDHLLAILTPVRPAPRPPATPPSLGLSVGRLRSGLLSEATPVPVAVGLVLPLLQHAAAGVDARTGLRAWGAIGVAGRPWDSGPLKLFWGPKKYSLHKILLGPG